MKYIVIFKAKINVLDDEYSRTAQLLREKALTQFNCQKFEAITENDFEIALSYWNSLEDIQTWHKDAEHQVAQRLGKEKWYKSFSVEICEIQKSYTDLNAK
ncbi:antibiotic biosynthesis monooxygenase family protein [Acinetobacter terrae]|jgi:heme-degrading monooxygenase HmoA|uniref:Antibiotic biosynthesis monooxygenase n=1 Tax=Acinetobacter terrae TaxID=2731247 RepID=A0A4R0EQ48_9GAMM|nr:antibiotic biosynthesis monooxygenase [Acinetobacter terrae]NNH15905.1 antibiotic biosynthesis monooxygenase [Acinetobacter terrae]NNH39190.1 antibiotic biosynthesis monooxygenase [Acinetobacter terrae]OAL85855.1 antibiotic biosynthesis monooxygenase [Acinetobacter terrae]OTG72023.1 antibiotic biosynthesis monooxygenase [Acinetobacter terrae]TCB61439.1 antibiotic biosynthesis monooxygenase [Acinetobacter terrae]